MAAQRGTPQQRSLERRSISAAIISVCPAALYKIDEDGKKSFDYAGCLECGTCRIACEGTIVKKWENPRPTMGVEYRFG